MVPADLRIIESKDLYVGQSSLTGESDAIKKLDTTELDFDTDIVSASRPQNAKYSEYMFPKSRRLGSDGELVGFVKLSLQS